MFHRKIHVPFVSIWHSHFPPVLQILSIASSISAFKNSYPHVQPNYTLDLENWFWVNNTLLYLRIVARNKMFFQVQV